MLFEESQEHTCPCGPEPVAGETPGRPPSLGTRLRFCDLISPNAWAGWWTFSCSPSQDSLEESICKCVSKFSQSSTSRPSFHGEIWTTWQLVEKLHFVSPPNCSNSNKTLRCLCLMTHDASSKYSAYKSGTCYERQIKGMTGLTWYWSYCQSYNSIYVYSTHFQSREHHAVHSAHVTCPPVWWVSSAAGYSREPECLHSTVPLGE